MKVTDVALSSEVRTTAMLVLLTAGDLECSKLLVGDTFIHDGMPFKYESGVTHAWNRVTKLNRRASIRHNPICSSSLCTTRRVICADL